METVLGSPTNTGKLWKPNPYEKRSSRYLWTDAFAVCNYITLFYETQNPLYLEQADALINDVHETLGRDRDCKYRLGSATDNDPLLGGLRIGKKDPEGTRDGDGQYFHYLTKWMFALNTMSIARKDSSYNKLAIQLAKSIHPCFVYNRTSSRPRMYWKMSIDLTKPSVPSEGNLDPFDGYVTYKYLQEHSEDKTVLQTEIDEMSKIVLSKYGRYQSDDPLDLGEALWLAHFYPNEEWAKHVTRISLQNLNELWIQGYFEESLSYRLAFREFGTSLGLGTNKEANNATWRNRIEEIHECWKDLIYTRDTDITPIMFCASLIPGVFSRNWPQNA